MFSRPSRHPVGSDPSSETWVPGCPSPQEPKYQPWGGHLGIPPVCGACLWAPKFSQHHFPPFIPPEAAPFSYSPLGYLSILFLFLQAFNTFVNSTLPTPLRIVLSLRRFLLSFLDESAFSWEIERTGRVHACVCVCVRERGTERERQHKCMHERD